MQTEIHTGQSWQAKKHGNTYLLSIDSGVNLIETIEDFVKQENILSGEISGIGAVSRATLGFYDFENQEFSEQTFQEQMEVSSALGNIAYKSDELYIHMHVTLGNNNYDCYAGHLVEATIHGAAEFYIRTNPFKAIKTNVDNSDMWVYDLSK